MGRGITDMEDKLAKARQVFPWELLAAVITGELDPSDSEHLALMQEFVLALTPGSDYFNLYRNESASGYAGNMKNAAEAILKFHGLRKAEEPPLAVYKFFLQVSTQEIYRIIVTMSGDVPQITKEQLTL
jgi:hypothetical protein